MHSRIREKSDRPHDWSAPPASSWSDEATTAAWSPQDLNDVVRHAGTETSLPPSAAEATTEHAGVEWLDVSNSWIETTAILDESALREDPELTLTTQPYLSPISAQLTAAPIDPDALCANRSAAASSGVIDTEPPQPSAARAASGRPLLTLGTTARPRLSAAGRQLGTSAGPDPHQQSQEQRVPAPAVNADARLASSEPALSASATLRGRLETATRRPAVDDSRPVPTQTAAAPAKPSNQAAAARPGLRTSRLSETDTLRSIPPLPEALRNGGPTLPQPASAFSQPSAAGAFEPPPPTAAKTFRPAPALVATSTERRSSGLAASQAPSARSGAHPPLSAGTLPQRTGAHPPLSAGTPAARTGAHLPIPAGNPAQRAGAFLPSSDQRWIEPSPSRTVPLVPHAALLELNDNPFAKPPLWRRTWVQGAALLTAVCGASWLGYHLLTIERSPVLMSLHAAAIPAAPRAVPPETATSAASDPAPQPTAAGALEATVGKSTAPSRRRWMHRPRAAAQANHAALSSPSVGKPAENAELAELLPTERSDSPQAEPSSAAATASDSAPSAPEQASASAVEAEHGASKPNQAEGFNPGRAAPQSDPNLGTLRLNSRPWADIFIDGRPYGHTPQQTIGLASGQHLVKLTNREFGLTKIFLLEMAGGATVTRVVNLDEDQ